MSKHNERMPNTVTGKKTGFPTTPERDVVAKKTPIRQLPSDNTSSFTAPHKKVLPENRARDPFSDIVAQTALDQAGSFGKGVNLGSEAKTKYNSKTIKGINLVAERIKASPASPLVGDLIINTGQSLLKMVDDQIEPKPEKNIWERRNKK